MSVSSPSDYAVIITNLYSAFNIFCNEVNGLNEQIRIFNKKPEQIENNFNNSKSQEDSTRELNKQFMELGLDKLDKKNEIKTLNGFIEFLKNIVFDNVNANGEKYNIFMVNICYKIGEFMSLNKDIEKKNNELYIAKNDPEQISKNNNLKLSEEEEKYFYHPLDIYNLYICPFTY